MLRRVFDCRKVVLRRLEDFDGFIWDCILVINEISVCGCVGVFLRGIEQVLKDEDDCLRIVGVVLCKRNDSVIISI